MPTLSVTNSGSTTVVFQDPTGWYVFSISLDPGDSYVGNVSLDLLSRLISILDNLVTGGNITYTVRNNATDIETDPAALKTKYLVAVNEKVHMDSAPLVLLPDLVSGDLLATAIAQYLTIAQAWNTHFADGGGSATKDADHKTADSINLVPVSPLVTLSDLESILVLAAAAVVGHGNQSTVHFHDDTGTSGTGFTMTNASPTTQAQCNADINDLKHAYNVHVGLASL